MRYFPYLFVLLGGLWFTWDFLLPGRTLRDWRQKAKTFFGMFAILWAMLSLCAVAHPEIRYSGWGTAFYSFKGTLGGMAIGLLICLSLAAEKHGTRKNIKGDLRE
jgi:ABC-type phosphate/phosphonate transport system permease subunit